MDFVFISCLFFFLFTSVFYFFLKLIWFKLKFKNINSISYVNRMWYKENNTIILFFWYIYLLIYLKKKKNTPFYFYTIIKSILVLFQENYKIGFYKKLKIFIQSINKGNFILFKSLLIRFFFLINNFFYNCSFIICIKIK